MPLLRSAFASVAALAILSACSNASSTAAAAGTAPQKEFLQTSLSADWPTFQAYPSHNAVLQESLDVAWNVQLGGKINGGLAFSGNRLFTDSFDHFVYALDRSTGKVLWKTEINNVVMSTPVVSDGLVIVGSGHDGWLDPTAPDPQNQIWGRPEGDALYGLSENTGAVQWKFQTVGDDMASPTIVGDRVIFANGDLHAYALAIRTGRLIWRIPLAGVASMDSATAHNGLVLVSTCRAAPHRCETIAIEVATGRVRWRNPIGSADASPAIGYGAVYVSSLNFKPQIFDQGGSSTIAAIDEKTGLTRWTWTSSAGPCTFVGSGEHEIAGTLADGIYFVSIGCGASMVALDALSGKLLWETATWAHVKMSPVIFRGRVYFGDTNGVFYVLSERTGHLIKAVSFDQMFTTAPFVIVGRTVFLACSSEIYAYPVDAAISPLQINTHDVRTDRPIINGLTN